MSPASLMELFSVFIKIVSYQLLSIKDSINIEFQRNPNGALMLLEKFDEQMSFSSKYPDVYNNCLVRDQCQTVISNNQQLVNSKIIGFGLTLRHRVALEKFKTLLNTPTESNNPFKGKLFPMTVHIIN